MDVRLSLWWLGWLADGYMRYTQGSGLLTTVFLAQIWTLLVSQWYDYSLSRLMATREPPGNGDVNEQHQSLFGTPYHIVQPTQVLTPADKLVQLQLRYCLAGVRLISNR